MSLAFIIALNKHRVLGNIFTPYLIKKTDTFYPVVSHVLSSDIGKYDYSFSSGEAELVRLTEQYIDENLARRFSLKAGGVGLNLIEAGYVFIIDPWWNPASEDQAISRAHRIGQDKHVFVYRFINENSIEEKIQQLKEQKSRLAEKVINSNNSLRSVTKDELLDFLNKKARCKSKRAF